MAYVQDIVSRALRVLRVLDPLEAPEAVQMENGIIALNAMVGAWEGVGRAIGWSPVAAPGDLMPSPDEHEECIVYNLACKLRPEYNKAIDPDVVEFAKSGLSQLRAAVANSEFLRMDLDLPRAESERRLGGGDGFYRGT